MRKRRKKVSENITSGESEKLTVKMGKIDSITIYQVTQQELETLEKGRIDSIFLNFAIFSLSIASSFLIVLLTTDIISIKVYASFLIVIILGFLSGLILLILWYISRKPVKTLIEKIKKRVKIKEG
jgi:hypothetical protein